MTFILIALVICLLIQLFYWYFIFVQAADHIVQAADSVNKNPFLSVVICFHKPWKEIPTVLSAIEKQTYRNFEVVLVNDGPVNVRYTHYQNYIKNNGNIRYIEHPKSSPGKKGALAAGIKAAKGDWVALTDIDCRLGQLWLERIGAHIPASPGILLGYSPYTSKPGFLNFIIQQETLLTAFQYLGWARAGHAYMGVGRNMVYYKEIFHKITFDSHIHIPTGDDDLFVNEASAHYPVSIYNDPSSFVLSDPATSWGTWYQQKIRHKSAGKYYSSSSKRRLAGFVVAMILEKILLVYLLFSSFGLFLIFAGVKIAFTIGPLRKLYRKFDQASGVWKMWIYEWFHVIYLILVVPYIFFKTKQRWD